MLDVPQRTAARSPPTTPINPKPNGRRSVPFGPGEAAARTATPCYPARAWAASSADTSRSLGPGNAQLETELLEEPGGLLAERDRRGALLGAVGLPLPGDHERGHPLGPRGFVDGADSGVYSVAPLARLNAAESMATPIAEAARAEYFTALGGRPVHHTLANHWARVIEMLYAAERMNELLADPDITSKDIRTIPTETPTVGVGVVEAPRGTLIHHYETDRKSVV